MLKKLAFSVFSLLVLVYSNEARSAQDDYFEQLADEIMKYKAAQPVAANVDVWNLIKNGEMTDQNGNKFVLFEEAKVYDAQPPHKCKGVYPETHYTQIGIAGGHFVKTINHGIDTSYLFQADIAGTLEYPNPPYKGDMIQVYAKLAS